VAVTLHNHFDLSLSGSQIQLEITSGIDPQLHSPCLEMIRAAGKYFFAQTGMAEKPFILQVENQVPIARGLASSATLRLSVLVGLNRLLEAGISDQDLVKMVSELEVCTDNAAASFFGGIAASGIVNGRLICYRRPVADALDFVAVWPSEAVETIKARTIFPAEIPRADAVFNCNRAVLLALAFADGDYDRIGDLLEDRLHQPYRQARIAALKPLYNVIEAARSAGALGGYLSGSGSTIMAITRSNRESVAQAMQQAFAAYEMKSEYRLLKADNAGVQCEWR